MTWNDVNNLNASISGVGDALLRNKMMAAEQQRFAQQQGVEQQRLGMEGERVGFEAQRLGMEGTRMNQAKASSDRSFKIQEDAATAAKIPKVTAHIVDPDTGHEFDWSGNQESLDAIQKAKPNLKIQGKKAFAGSLNIGGGTMTFDNQDSFDSAVEAFKAQGIDPFSAQFGKRYSPNKADYLKSLQGNYASQIKAAEEARANGDDTAAEYHMMEAEQTKNFINKNSFFAGQVPTTSTTTKDVLDPMGRPVLDKGKNPVKQSSTTVKKPMPIGNSGLPDYSQADSPDKSSTGKKTMVVLKKGGQSAEFPVDKVAAAKAKGWSE